VPFSIDSLSTAPPSPEQCSPGRCEGQAEESFAPLVNSLVAHRQGSESAGKEMIRAVVLLMVVLVYVIVRRTLSYKRKRRVNERNNPDLHHVVGLFLVVAEIATLSKAPKEKVFCSDIGRKPTYALRLAFILS